MCVKGREVERWGTGVCGVRGGGWGVEGQGVRACVLSGAAGTSMHGHGL